METDRKEVVYAITIQAKEALEQYRQFVAANNDAKAALTANNKALRENQAALDATAKSLKADGTNADEVARKTADLTAKRKELNRTNADLKASIAGLSSQERELKNDISGTTEAGLRFRDKMSEAFAGQLNQKLGVLQTQLVAAQKAANDAAASLGRGSPEAAKTAAAVKSLEAEITKLKGVTDGGFESMRSKLRQANAELNQAVTTFGRGSKEVAALAARVDELNDELEITKQQAAGADLEGKFELMGNAASKVTNIVGGVTAGLQLLGAEKGTIEEVGKAILALQQAQAIAEGLKSLGSLGKTLTALGASLGLVTTATQASAIASGEDAVAKTAEGEAAVVATGANKAFVLSMATNPIFLAVAAIVAITAAVVAFSSEVKDATVDYKALIEAINTKFDTEQKFRDFRTALQQVDRQIARARAGQLEDTEQSILQDNAALDAKAEDDIRRSKETLAKLEAVRDEARDKFLSSDHVGVFGLDQESLDEDKKNLDLAEEAVAKKAADIEALETNAEFVRKEGILRFEEFKAKVRDEDAQATKKATDEAIKEAKRRKDELLKVEQELDQIEKAQRPDTEANAIADVNAQFDALVVLAKGNADLLVRIEEDRVTALNNVLFGYMTQKFENEAAITQNEKDELATRATQINDYAAAFSQSNLDLAQSVQDAQQQVVEAMTGSAVAFTSALTQMAGDNAAAQQFLFVLSKAAAIADVIVKSQAEIAGYYATWSPVPGGVAVATALSTAARIRAATSVGIISAQTIAQSSQGLAEGGIVTNSWGRPVSMPNGDNVLVGHSDGGAVTLQTGEAVLTLADQAAVKQRTGYSVFELARGEPVRALIGQSSFAIGGMVPRPSSSQVQQAAATQAFREFDPTVVADIVEISKHLKRLDVRENINTSG